MNELVNAIQWSPWMLEVAMVMVAIMVLVVIGYTILYGPRSAVR